jgi:hypothetical protein
MLPFVAIAASVSHVPQAGRRYPAFWGGQEVLLLLLLLLARHIRHSLTNTPRLTLVT